MPRDDRVLTETRVIAVAVTLALALGAIILYGFPSRTDDLFAWTIRPDMTPLLMGSGYAAGCYFFIRVATEEHWSHVTAPWLGIGAFSTMTLIATLLHWERFNHDHASFWSWTALYIVTPVLVPGIWLWNRRTDPRTLEADDVSVPDWLRWAVGAIGVVVGLGAIVFFLNPDTAIDIWPWQLSPLTARVVAGWLAVPAGASLVIATERRWSAWRVPLEIVIIWMALLLLAIPRAWDDFEGGIATSLFIAGAVVWLLATLAIRVGLERRHSQAEAVVQPAGKV